MTDIAFVNGSYVSEHNANISIFDRGFLFADAVYEVTAVINGKLIDNERHLDRLLSSLDKINLSCSINKDELQTIQQRLIEQNQLNEGIVYIQISRGADNQDVKRNLLYPNKTNASIVVFTQEKVIVDLKTAETGIAIKFFPDVRWTRRDIKTVSLLPQSMARQAAVEYGVQDAWMVEEGTITEGASNNVFIVDQQGNLITRPVSHSILAGITRQAILDIALNEGINIQERPIKVEEVFQAKEAFSTSASTIIQPVVKADNQIIDEGRVGEVGIFLRKKYLEKYVF